MSVYTIKDLSQLSRIKPHTLRVWEQRYGILQPTRSDANFRQYSQDELKYLLNVVLLYESGFKISKIAQFSREDLEEEVRKLSLSHLEFPLHIQNLVISMLDLNEDRFVQLLSHHILALGLEETMVKIIYPFLHQIGILWQTNAINPAQEHFITHLIRQKLMVAIDGLGNSRRKPDGLKVILFLPEGELHEISLLFGYYLIRYEGHHCIYLGQSLPIGDIAEIQRTHKADVLFTTITSVPCLQDVEPYLFKLREAVPTGSFWVSGFQILSQEIQFPTDFQVIKDNLDLKKLLRETKPLASHQKST